VSPIAGDVLGSVAGEVESLMEISSATPSSSTRKLNSPKAISKPPILPEAMLIKLETGSTTAVTGGSMASAEAKSAMFGDAVSETVDPMTSTILVGGVVLMAVGTAMPTRVVDAVSMSMLVLVSKLVVSELMSMSIGDAESIAIANDEPSNLVGEERSAMVGDGAGESVDPEPVVPMVGAN
jgi:hypothetical protein